MSFEDHLGHNTELIKNRGTWILLKCYDCNMFLEICNDTGNTYYREYPLGKTSEKSTPSICGGLNEKQIFFLKK